MRDALLDLVERGRTRTEFGCDTRDRPGEPARNNQVEMREFWRNIECETVQRNIARESHPDRSNLALGNPISADPNTGRGWITNSRETVLGKGVDDALLEKPYIRMHAQAETLDVENWIGDELPRAVIGHVTASIGLDALDALRGEHLVIGEHMGRRSGPARYRNDSGRMLEKKDRHWCAGQTPFDHTLVRLALKPKRVEIAHATKVDDNEGLRLGKRAHSERKAYDARPFPYNRRVPNIHPTAVLHGDIQLADDVEIGPHCVLNGSIRLGSGCGLVGGVHLQGPLSMGTRNVCYPGCSIGFAPQDLKFAHSKDGAGTVVGDGNTFRENVTIHRATRDDRPTRIGDRNYWMACSHAGHDVQIANDCIFANNTLFAGHAEIGDRVVTGGGAGVHQFVRIGRGAMLGGLCGASKDVCPFFTLTATNYIGGFNRIGLRRGGASAEDVDLVKRMYGILVRSRQLFSTRVCELETLAGHPLADEFIAFVKSSKRGVSTRHGRVTFSRASVMEDA